MKTWHIFVGVLVLVGLWWFLRLLLDGRNLRDEALKAKRLEQDYGRTEDADQERNPLPK